MPPNHYEVVEIVVGELLVGTVNIIGLDEPVKIVVSLYSTITNRCIGKRQNPASRKEASGWLASYLG